MGLPWSIRIQGHESQRGKNCMVFKVWTYHLNSMSLTKELWPYQEVLVQIDESSWSTCRLKVLLWWSEIGGYQSGSSESSQQTVKNHAIQTHFWALFWAPHLFQGRLPLFARLFRRLRRSNDLNFHSLHGVRKNHSPSIWPMMTSVIRKFQTKCEAVQTFPG